MEPGLTTTWPRSTSSRFRPRSRRPQFSPAHASSSCLWNISIPVTVVFWTGRMPTISTSELMARVPRSARPVTTVPRPVMVKTSSIGIRNGLSRSRTGSGTDSSTAAIRSSTDLTHSGSPSSAFRPETRTTGALSPSKPCELRNFHFDQVEQFFVVDHVSLVQGDQQVGNTNLAGQQNVLAGLSHRAVGSGNHEDCAVHLGSTGDHVLDVVSVAGGVNVCVVTLLGLVLHVGDVDGNTALTLFGCRVDRREVTLLVEIRVLVVQHLGNGGRQRRLTVVNVTNGADVDVRLSPLELCLCHRFLLERFQIACPPAALIAVELRQVYLGGFGLVKLQIQELILIP